VAFEAVGQPCFAYPALMLFEGRDVRVAEHREAIRAKFDALTNRIEARCDGLMRQSVDQIEIDVVDAGSSEICRHGGGLLETLYPMDGALDDRIEALHTEAHPIDASIGQRIDHRVGKRARVYLDGNVSGGKDKEGVPDCSDQIRECLGRHDRRRSTAKVNMINPDPLINLAR
jgi:hypothetical protein